MSVCGIWVVIFIWMYYGPGTVCPWLLCGHNYPSFFFLFQAFDRLQQRNERLWAAIKSKSEETGLDDTQDTSMKSEASIKTEPSDDKKGQCTTLLICTKLLARMHLFYRPSLSYYFSGKF